MGGQRSGKRKGTLIGIGSAANKAPLGLKEEGATKETTQVDETTKVRPVSSHHNAEKTSTNVTKTTGSASAALNLGLPKIESNVIKIIQREWDKEVERLDAKRLGYKGK